MVSYWWDGKVMKETEYLMIMKSQPEKLSLINDYFKDHHPYDCPELISLPVTVFNGSLM
jgi:periplasmic divalent cation tolerance protein